MPPPPIYVVESPAFLLFINGKPFATAVGDTGLELIGNANFPVFRDTKTGNYYLLSGDYRYMSAKLAGPWGTIAELPPAFRKIPARGEFASIAAVVATPPKSGAAPAIITTFKPAEIVVLDGKPQGREISGTDGLESIMNTESPLFRLDGTYYLLVAGRWFSTQGSDARSVEVHDAVARCVCDASRKAMKTRTCAHPCPGRSRRAAPCWKQKLPETKTGEGGRGAGDRPSRTRAVSRSSSRYRRRRSRARSIPPTTSSSTATSTTCATRACGTWRTSRQAPGLQRLMFPLRSTKSRRVRRPIR